MEDCIVYLVFQLRQAGFEVKFTWPNILWISWKHTEGEYLTKQNPIIQAMTPEPPPTLQKAQSTSQKKGKQAQVQFATSQNTKAYNEEIHLINSGSIQPSSFGNTPITATPKSAADYRPPDSFIQQLERPGPDRPKQGLYKSTGSGGNEENARGNILTDLWNF